LLRRTFKAFQYPDFRLMWTGACLSTIGTWMQTQAQSWLVLEISGSPFYLGLDAFLGQIPIFLFTLVGGVLADRIDRRRILLGSQLVQMTCALTLALLFTFGAVQIWHILALSFVVGTAQAFGGPAYQALIPTLVGKEDLPNAIALNSIQFNLARMIGPALGLVALTKLGAAACFYLNGLSYVAVIITLLIVKTAFTPKSTTVSVLDSMKQGFAYIRGQSFMKSLIVIAFLMTMFGIPMLTFLPVFARDIFHQGPNGYTLLLEVTGAGSILGALLVATFHQGRNKWELAVTNLILLGVTVVAFSFSRNLALSCAMLFIGSAALISTFSLVASLVQESIADDIRGRVMSVYNMAFRGGMPFGSLISGKFVERYSAPPVVAVNGVLLACLGLYFLLVRKQVRK
jgi:predicted MFS family arabinose efflux permease